VMLESLGGGASRRDKKREEFTESKLRHWLIWNCKYIITSGRYAPKSNFVKIRFRGGFWSEWWSITARLFISASPTDQTRWQIFTCNSKMCNYSGMCLLESIWNFYTVSPNRLYI